MSATLLVKIKLSEIAKIKGGKRLPKGFDVQDEITSHPYIRVTDMDDNGLIISNIKYISDEAFSRVKNYIISSNDIYLSIAGTIGRVGIVPESLSGANLTENAVKITEIDKQYNKKYIMYFLQGSYGQGLINSKTGGTSQPKLALYRIKEINIPNLQKEEQDLIVEIVEKYNDLIDNNRKRIQLLEESARLLFREWFVYFRFPLRLRSGQAGHEKVHPVRKSDSNGVKIVDGVPEGWGKGLLEDVAKVRKGKNITFEQATEGDIPVVGGGLEPTYYHNKANVSAPVITISASGANAGFVNLYDTDIWASDCSYIDKISTKHFYCLYLRLKSLQSTIFGLQVGAAQPHVYPKDLNRLSLLIAPDDLCRQFEQLVTPIFYLIKNLKLENQKLSQARDLLLPRLMSGVIDLIRYDKLSNGVEL